VNQKYAYLPDENKQLVIDQQLEKIYADPQQALQINALVKQSAAQIRAAFQNDKGETYLNDIDTWFQYYWARNYVNNGFVGDKQIDGQSYSIHRDGRFLFSENPRFHPWMLAQWYYFYHLFDSGASLMKTTWFFTVFFTTLAVIPAFFIGRRFAGNLGGLVAGILLGAHTSLLSRTIGGFADTDPQNVVWPMLVLWFLMESFEVEETWKKLTFSSLAGISMGFYSLGWSSGWWHTFILFLIAIAVYTFHIMLKNRKHIGRELLKLPAIKGLFYDVAPYLVMSCVSIVVSNMVFAKFTLSRSIMVIVNTFLGPLSFIIYKSVGVATIWPNVLTTVAELNLAPMSQIIGMMGGKILFLVALLGFTLLLINKRSGSKEWKFILYSIAYYIVMMLVIDKVFDWVKQDALWLSALFFIPWIVAYYLASFKEYEFSLFSSFLLGFYLAITCYASTRGIRFTALMVMPFALLIGIGVGRIFTYGSEFIHKKTNLNKMVTKIALLILLLWIVLPGQLAGALSLSRNELTSMNDAWYDSLTAIKQASPSGNAIITSWWDFGHWFVAIAERSVTFDGGNQGYRIHWVGRVLATGDEEEAMDILRMLNCGQEHSYNAIYNKTNDEYTAVKLLYKVMKEDKTEARKSLFGSGFSDSETDEIMNLTHYCKPWQQFFIASEDMVGKGAVWAHFGLWDFDRAEMYNKVHNSNYEDGVKMLTEKFNVSPQDADKLYNEIKSTDGDQWIMDWPGYESNDASCSNEKNSTINRCSNGFVFNVTSEAGYFQSDQGEVVPYSISFIDKNGKFKEVKQENSNTEKYFGKKISVIIGNRDGKITSITSDYRLASSVFTKLFFFDGKGLDNFKMISLKTGVDGSEIKVFEVNWPDEK
jgi:dolichyl-diphosphooligosaccharide--protein glycosyltransferase